MLVALAFITPAQAGKINPIDIFDVSCNINDANGTTFDITYSVGWQLVGNFPGGPVEPVEIDIDRTSFAAQAHVPGDPMWQEFQMFADQGDIDIIFPDGVDIGPVQFPICDDVFLYDDNANALRIQVAILLTNGTLLIERCSVPAPPPEVCS